MKLVGFASRFFMVFPLGLIVVIFLYSLIDYLSLLQFVDFWLILILRCRKVNKVFKAYFIFQPAIVRHANRLAGILTFVVECSHPVIMPAGSQFL